MATQQITTTSDIYSQQNRRYLTVAQIAQHLAISTPAVRALQNREIDPLPCIPFSSKTIRYDVHKVDEWAARQGEATT